MNRNDKFYTIEEATEMLGISEQEVISMITLKKLPAIKVEKAIKIKDEDLEKFLNSLGRKDTADENEIGKTMEVLAEDKNEVKIKIENKKMQLEKSYKDLLRKKQELEEDINYLQYKYDEFRNRIKKITTEELKIFLKKINEDNLKENGEILQNNFDDDLDIGGDIDKTMESEEDDYTD